MNLNLNIVIFKVVLVAFSTIVCVANQPPYQVALYVHVHPLEPAIHLCNGVIVQSRLILTTASCVHYKISSSSSSLAPIASIMISVKCGSSTAFNDELTLQVGDIIVANNFNYTTGENDLALLRLNGILPLDTHTDISWITLEDNEKYESPCLANFYLRNAQFPNGAPNYIQSEQLPILSSESCRTASEDFIGRENDICSLYYLPADFNCNAFETIQKYNVDRGTGLICGNKLIGLLSTILPRQNITSCIEKPIKAYFSAIVPRIEWIFKVIAEEDMKMLAAGEYIASKPYAGETNAVVEPHVVTESETIPANYSTQTTEFQNQHNAAVFSKTNFKLLSFIFGIICLMWHAASY